MAMFTKYPLLTCDAPYMGVKVVQGVKVCILIYKRIYLCIDNAIWTRRV